MIVQWEEERRKTLIPTFSRRREKEPACGSFLTLSRLRDAQVSRAPRGSALSGGQRDLRMAG